MTEVLEIDGLIFEVRRSKRRRTIGMVIERHGALIVQVPDEAELHEVEPLVRTKLDWVHQKLLCKQEAPPDVVFRQPEFIDGEGFFFLGRHYRLKLVDPRPEDGPVETVRFDGDRLLLRRSQAPHGGKRIAEYYTRAGYPYLTSSVDRWKRIVGATPARFINVADLGFHWGSCSADGTLNFHWRVMQLPPRVVDYVVVHELCHLLVRDHSPEFWREIQRVMPDYQQQKDWLRENGGRL